MTAIERSSALSTATELSERQSATKTGASAPDQRYVFEGQFMKKIEVIFPPSRMYELRETLAEHLLFEFIVSDVKDIAPKNTRVIEYKGVHHESDEKAAFKLELITDDNQASSVTEALAIALVGYGSDSKILVTSVHEAPTH
jgi:nitrogen regulatory protein PII